MLKTLYPGKASMLHGNAFADKVEKLKKKMLDEEQSEFNSVLGLDNKKLKEKNMSKIVNIAEDKQDFNDRKKELDHMNPILKEVHFNLERLKNLLWDENRRIIRKIEHLYEILRE